MIQFNLTLNSDELVELYDLLGSSRSKVLDDVHAAVRSVIIGAMSGKIVNLNETHLLRTNGAGEELKAWLEVQKLKLEELKNAGNEGNASGEVRNSSAQT